MATILDPYPRTVAPPRQGTVHHLLAADDGVRDALVARLGPEILGEDGRPDRARIARAVFGDPERLAWLEGLLHPLVSQEYLTWRERLAELDDPPRVCVTEVPLLYEVGAQDRFDKVIVITAPAVAPRSRVSPVPVPSPAPFPRRRERGNERLQPRLPVRTSPRREDQLELFTTARRSLRLIRGGPWVARWLRFGRRLTRWHEDPERAAHRAVFRLASRAMPAPLRDTLWLARGLAPLRGRHR